MTDQYMDACVRYAQASAEVRRLGKVISSALEACSDAQLAAWHKGKITYSYSINGENFYGEFKTLEEAALEAFSCDPSRDAVWVGEVNKPTAHEFVSGDRIIEDVMNFAADECGECSGDWLYDLARNKEKAAELKKIVGDWIHANDPPTFWTVEHERLVYRDELIESGHLSEESV